MRASVARVDGYLLSLRLVTEEDAIYIHELRSDPCYNAHLSAVSGTAEDQREWIARYKARESAGHELYRAIERADGLRCGVVRLYDISEDNFTWGSWILDEIKPPKGAPESAFLIYKLAFDIMGLKKAIFDVHMDNDHTISFHIRFGARETDEDQLNRYFEYESEQFAQVRDQLAALLAQNQREYT